MLREKMRIKKQRIKVKFQQAAAEELREHRCTFLVFSALRFLIIAVLIRQLILRNYEGAFLCVLTMLLLYVPNWIQIRLHIELPPPLEVSVLCFIFAAEILGKVNAFYIVIPGWDTMLHTINGFLAAAVGFSLAMLLNKNKRLVFHLSPFFLSIVAFCFSMTVGVLWEFFEFGADLFLHTDMQKDTVIHAIYSVALDPAHSNRVVSVKEIQEVIVDGLDLGVGGYLDIGLADTMKDLFVNFIGAVIFCSIGGLCIAGKPLGQKIIRGFVPRPRGLKNRLHESKGVIPLDYDETTQDIQK